MERIMNSKIQQETVDNNLAGVCRIKLKKGSNRFVIVRIYDLSTTFRLATKPVFFRDNEKKRTISGHTGTSFEESIRNFHKNL